MLRPRFLGLILSVVVIACSTTSKHQGRHFAELAPPRVDRPLGHNLDAIDYFFEKRLETDSSQPSRWWSRYSQGQLWMNDRPERACRNFLDLADAKDFPLRSLALIRAIEICPVVGPESERVPSVPDALELIPEPWLRSMIYKAGLKRSVALGDEAKEAELSLEVSKFESNSKRKVELVLRALAIVEKNNELEKAEPIRTRLWQIAPRYLPNPLPIQRLEVAQDFRRNREFDRARAIYQDIAQHDAEESERFKALDGLRMTYKLEGKVDQFLQATKTYSDFAKNRFKKKNGREKWAKRYHDSIVTYARALWTEGQVSEAAQLLKKLKAELHGRFPTHEISWIQARMSEEVGNFKEVTLALSDVAIASHIDEGLLQKVLWTKAWNLRKVGDLRAAAELFQYMIDREPNPINTTRTRFWLSKTLKQMNKGEEATVQLNWLKLNDPLGFYGLLAYRESGESLPALNPTSMAAGDSGPQTSTAFDRTEDQLYVDWLISVNEHDVAKSFLDHLSQVYRSRHQSDPMAWREFLRYYARAGEYQSLFSQLSLFDANARNAILTREPSLLFPQPFKSVVDSAALQFQVESELIYAIMRQESSFDPQARSIADAFGLLQLLPRMAKTQEKSTGLTLTDDNDLFIPEMNVPMGAALLRDLFARFDQKFILSVAAYNASERAIHGWMRTRFRGETLEFIEDIPYDETRGYVKLVMRNYIFYKRLNAPEQNLTFPESLLRL